MQTNSTRETTTVLHIASECAPFAKTGGLADVVAALPRALAHEGVRAMIALPRHRAVDTGGFALARRLAPIDVPLGTSSERVSVYEGTLPGGRVPVLLIDHPWFDREGLYGDAQGEYPDNGLRYALLSRAALEAAHRLDVWPQIVHAHDWQAGLGPLYARRQAVQARPAPKTVFTVHNLAFRGLFDKHLVERLGLGWEVWNADGAEFYDSLCFLKAGLAYADRITTVSPRYAREIQTPEAGAGLDGFLRHRAHALVGILNGIDTDEWGPAVDPALPVRFDAADPSGKAACKAALQRELGLPVRAALPLVATLSPITEAKGFDLIVAAGEDLARLDAQLVFFGAGDGRFEQALRELGRRYPGKIAVRTAPGGAEVDAATRRVHAGADLLLMPSRSEPCGLTQMCALRYGTVPVVRATGGLDDTVVDFDDRTRTGSGFKFDEAEPAAMVHALKRALTAYKHRDAWVDLVQRAMRLDFSWTTSARRYAELYRELAKQG
jgi:starch synthase